MNVYRVISRSKSSAGEQVQSDLIVAPSLMRAAVEGERIAKRAHYSWNKRTALEVECIGAAKIARGAK